MTEMEFEVKTVLTRALAQPVVLVFEKWEDAKRFRGRCYAVVRRARARSQRDPMASDYDTSPWDAVELKLTKKGEQTELLMRVPTASDLGIIEVRMGKAGT